VNTIRLIGGPTALLEYGGLRLLTDPTFSPAGEFLSSSGARLVKTAGPALSPEQLGRVDAVLLSHDQHPDNLDAAGRALTAAVPLTLTTPSAAGRLSGSARPLATWQRQELRAPGGGRVQVTAVPAVHGPDGAESVLGEVTGFVLAGEHLPTVYISGDNASLPVVREIAARAGHIDVAVLFAGAARSGAFNNALLTLDSPQAAQAADILGARQVIAVHFEQWAHLGEGARALEAAFKRAGLADRLTLLQAGARADLVPAETLIQLSSDQ
jgi:L-ascorbate metabolism protein UlaG (beta-lactamase superfamily)